MRAENFIIFSPSILRAHAHSKLSCSILHDTSNHQSVTWLEHVQWTRHVGETHGADKHRNLSSVPDHLRDLLFIDLLPLEEVCWKHSLDGGLYKLIYTLQTINNVKY